MGKQVTNFNGHCAGDALKFLTPKMVEEKYNIPVGTLAQWRYRRVGPRYYKASRNVRYIDADIENFLLSNPVLTVDQQ